jgi:hypothetical protein
MSRRAISRATALWMLHNELRRPDLVVLAGTLPGTLERLTPQLTALAQRARLVLAGVGATPEIATALGPGC